MYCTLDDLTKSIPEERIIELTDDSSPPVSVDEEVVEEQIGKADAIIDGYLRGRYVLPLSPVPSIIKDCSVDIAVYYLYGRRPHDGIPEEIRNNYTDRIRILKDIQKGDFIIDSEAEGSGDIDTSGVYRCNKTSSERLFTKDLLNRF